MIIMWITITIYFDFSHVPTYSLFMSSSNKFKVWFRHFIVYAKHVDYYHNLKLFRL